MDGRIGTLVHDRPGLAIGFYAARRRMESLGGSDGLYLVIGSRRSTLFFALGGRDTCRICGGTRSLAGREAPRLLLNRRTRTNFYPRCSSESAGKI